MFVIYAAWSITDDNQARDSKLMLDDLNGGNFTISNPGIFGSMFGTPLINYPQSAVFNMNSIRDEAVVVDGKIEIRPVRDNSASRFCCPKRLTKLSR